MVTNAQREYMALEAALRAGDLAAVERLFSEEGSFPNVRDPLTWTHLVSLAISWSPLETISRLFDLGGDPNFEPDRGFPAVYAALASDRPDRHQLLALLLARGADPNRRGINDYTPLHVAVARRDRAAMALLLAHGADPSLKTRIDECATPEREAELRGNPEGAAMLRSLINPGA
jgi:uncharacterized protein